MTAALYYQAPLDVLFIIPWLLLVWYAIDREVVRYYRQKEARRQQRRERLRSQEQARQQPGWFD